MNVQSETVHLQEIARLERAIQEQNQVILVHEVEKDRLQNLLREASEDLGRVQDELRVRVDQIWAQARQYQQILTSKDARIQTLENALFAVGERSAAREEELRRIQRELARLKKLTDDLR